MKEVIYPNRIIRMVMDSSYVYVDGKTIKDRHKKSQYSDDEVKDIMENIERYHITFFNRDLSNGERVLKLTSDYIL